MNTFTKTIIILLLSIAILTIAKPDEINWNDQLPNGYRSTIVGASMEHLGFHEGDKVNVEPDSNHMYFIGDIVAFVCNKPKCPKENAMLKEIKNIDGECFWLEGRPDIYTYRGIESVSLDSRKYGWLCGDQITIIGLVER